MSTKNPAQPGLDEDLDDEEKLDHLYGEKEKYAGPNVESFCCQDPTTLMKPVFKLFDLKTKRLQHIFNSESDDMLKNF